MTPCIFGLHDWEMWIRIEVVEIDEFGGKERYPAQTRTCARCGVTQRRRL
jgi:hypothetical protein